MAIIARAIRTITDLFDPIQQGTAPVAPVTGMLWLDTALTPNQLKRWSGTAWVTVNDPTGILTRLNAAETKITDSAIVSTVRSSSEYLADLSGKNRTWLQTTAPTGAAVGDLWIDTANGNLLKRWNGSSWANVQDAAVSIAQQTANKISWIIASGTSASNMTLTSQLYSLVSQNVVINANNLTATARNTLKLEAVELIQVGGTNLLPLTSGDYLDVVHSNTYIRSINVPLRYPLSKMNLVPGDTVTARAYIKTDANVPAGGYRLEIVCYYGTTEITAYGGNYIPLLSEGYSSVTFVIPETTDAIRTFLCTYGKVYFTGTEQYKRLKLETGNKATDWSPSPSDPAVGVKTSYITIDSDSIDIVSGGKLTLASANDLIVSSGKTLSAYATEQITLGVGAIQVGGTNLIPNSYFDITSGLYGFATTTISGLKNSTEYTLSFSGNVATPGTGTFIRCYIYADDWSYSVYAETQSTTATIATLTFTAPANIEGKTIKFGAVSHPNGNGGTVYLRWAKLEKGNIATDWSPSPLDPAAGVKTSYINIDNDSIEISSGGSLTLTSPTTLAITSGSTNATAIAIRNDTNYFISAGHVTQSSAPFYVKKDGSFKAISGIIGGFAFTEDTFADSATLGNYMKIQPYAKQVWFGNMYIGQDGMVPGWFLMSPNMYCTGAVSALSFTDRTPIYTGNALAALSAVKDNGKGGIDHASLPPEARKTIQKKLMDEGGKPVLDANKKPVMFEEPGRDLGMMISILIKAVQEIKERLEKLEGTNGQGV